MGRKKKNKSPAKSPSAAATAAAAAEAVDIITGKATLEYYFDPSLILKENQGTTARQPTKTATKDLSSKYLYVPCTIIKPIDEENSQKSTGKADGQPFPGPTLVKTVDGVLHKITDSTKLIPISSPEDSEGVDDVLNLAQISEASLLHTLRIRYARNDIYTSAGPILISINPYVTVKQPDGQSIYCEERMLLYRTGYTTGPKSPHLFLVADRAYKALMDSVHSSTEMDHLEDEDAVMMLEYHKPPGTVRHQSIIISGESGAGKTEATKIIMAYLARITKRENKAGNRSAALEDRVLSSNPLLETFGNAQTLRNDNSSRFGKYIHIFFSTVTGAITGASISNYLLEKTRITSQVDGERNYHVFYQLLASASEEMLQEFGLQGGASSFHYLGRRITDNDIVDQEGFRQTMECLAGIGLDAGEQKALFATVAGVLHLGNIQFEEHDDPSESFTESIGKCRVTTESRASLQKACELLGLNEAQLEDAILTKVIVINGKSIKKAQTIPMAEDKRDALAKMTYSCLFLWLVHHINLSLNQASEQSKKPSKDQIGCIGVLDIYGFETFDVNGYEQLLINYCNEKLQSHFNRHLFEVEQKLYSNEGVDWSYITFNDNRPCLELIEGGSGVVGVLNTLDDAWGGMGTSAEKDSKFAAHLHRLFGKSSEADTKKDSDDHDNHYKYFITPKLGLNKNFIIKHYAGEVCYTVDGFVEKNMETLSKELKDLGESSSHTFLKAVYSTTGIEAQTSTSQRSSIRGSSVSWQFRSSLQTLVSDLERTQPHYIRCIKPNNAKLAGAFASADILKQLKYSGMMEAIRIRREGYALREEHETFYKRFSLLLGYDKISKPDHQGGIVQLVKVLSELLCVTEADWQIGHSKIFVRRVLADKLERLAKLRVHVSSRTLGRFGRQVAKRRISKRIATWIRFRMHMRAYYRNQKAASLFCATFKMWQQRKSFLTMRQKIILIQAQQRRRHAASIARKIRDPFFDVTLAECRLLLQQEQALLDEAVASNNFHLAASIEPKIANIQRAIEDKRPLTRAVLEEKIAAFEKRISDAIERKAYSDCAPLQAQLDQLISKRVELPTLDELKSDVQKAESDLSGAVQKRDFAGAADCQIRLDTAKQKLQVALQDMDVDDVDEKVKAVNGGDSQPMAYKSRFQLEEAIQSLMEQQNAKVKEKDFQGASSLQRKVDELEGLRQFFPSVDELEREVIGLKSKLEDAVEAKNFNLAGKLNCDIKETERRLKAELSVNNSPLGSKSEVQALGKKLAEGKSMRGAVQTSVKVNVSRGALLSSNGHARHRSSETSVRSANAVSVSGRSERTTPSAAATPISVRRPSAVLPTNHRSVAKLRPAVPLTGRFDEPILAIVKSLASKRANAAVIIDAKGGLAGIITDTDITRRVVAKDVNPAATSVSEVMTPNPTCVSLADSALDALSTMVENRFRHLPVIDSEGSVVGLLDIAKCLNEAISKLEKVQEKNSKSAEEVVHQVVSQQGAGGAQAVALQALLGTLMSQAFGTQSAPTLRSVLAGKPCTVVSPDTSLYDAGRLMAENRKAALVVDEASGELVGIFGFKDMMNRAIAKELPLSSTPISEVMTPSPEFISPENTVLEALQTMHDNHILTLPVCEATGQVVGLVDVMDVIYGCGGAEGWRSIFSSTMDVQDDLSDVTSVRSICEAQPTEPERPMASLIESSGEHPVSMLRPMKPLLSTEQDSILDVAQFLAAKRGVAALVTDSSGGLTGIITDTDITRRVVALGLSPTTTEVSSVMTKNPACVAMTDSAMDALTIMVENHFRHLPVVDSDRSVVGLIDIAKCLSGAIATLEKSQAKNDTTARATINHIMKQNADNGTQAAALQALLGPLISQAFGNKSLPTVRSILTGKPRTVVTANTSIFEAGQAMAENRKAALIIDDTSHSLLGIFGFKDMMTRAIAKELDLEETSVSSVMTTNPETVLPDVSVLEALQIMHDHRFLNLPVCEADGTVVGLVDVMDVIHGCGGADGWRSIFTNAMHLDDDGSAASSVHSIEHSVKSKLTSVAKKHVTDTTVEKLRPSKPILTDGSSSILIVTQLIQSKRGSASIIITPEGDLTGIITDTDITRRVVAKDVNPAATSVSEVMTPNPTCVSLADSALDALSTMVENRFRHLPVIDSEGSVVGLLDIAKCLNEAISKLEKVQEKNSKSAEEVVHQVVSQQGAGGAQAVALQALLGTLMSQAFGTQSAPTLRSVLAGKPCTVVSPDTSLYDAGRLMAENRKAALVVDEASGELVGIFGFKDMMNRAIAKELPLSSTPISEVMTPSPEFISPENTVLEALQTMHDNHILTLPVCEATGQVVGLVDVMDVIYGCGGAEGWRSIFSKAMELDDSTLAFSTEGSNLVPATRLYESTPRSVTAKAKLPGNIPSTLEFVHNDMSSAMDERGLSRAFGPDDVSECGDMKGTFKITDAKARTHRIRCEQKLDPLFTAISQKAELELGSFQVQYTDEEGDLVLITSDDDVAEAWATAQKTGSKVVKLDFVLVSKTGKGPDSLLLAAGAVSIIAICASAFFVLNRGKK